MGISDCESGFKMRWDFSSEKEKKNYFRKMNRLFVLLVAACVLVGACSKDAPGAFGNSLEVVDEEGTLGVNGKNLTVESETSCAKLIATYKNAKGLYEPSAITVEPYAQGQIDGDKMVFDLAIGTYTVKAKTLSMTVTVSLKE